MTKTRERPNYQNRLTSESYMGIIIYNFKETVINNLRKEIISRELLWRTRIYQKYQIENLKLKTYNIFN